MRGGRALRINAMSLAAKPPQRRAKNKAFHRISQKSLIIGWDVEIEEVLGGSVKDNVKSMFRRKL